MHWFTAAELAGLAGMPGSEFHARKKLVALGIPSRIREGRLGGGGREFDASALPAETRRALLLEQLRQAPEALPAEPPPQTPVPAPVADRRPPSRADAACADARVLLIKRMESMAAGAGGMTRAAELLSAQLLAAEVPVDLMRVAATANQRPRKAGEGVRIGVRTLFRWVAAHRTGGWQALLPAPVAGTALARVGDEVAQVLSRYHASTGAARNLTEVAQAVNTALGRPFDDWRRLYDQARRALAKVDARANVKLLKARHTGAERAALLPYKKRDTRTIAPLDVALIDGHTFKAKVRHPIHGAPFAPEVTVVLDAATRKITGWSVSLSENTIAVGDAIRRAVGTHGQMALAYTDNGGGETAKALDCPVAGLFARLGTEHRTGIPGHPQGHGLIERSWQTHMIRCARQFGSYQGGDADSGNVRRARLEFAREQTALKRAEQSGDVVRLSAKAPSWQQFMQAVEQAVHDYNTLHRHRGLPRHASGPHAGKHMTPAEAWAAWLVPEDQDIPSAATLRHLFMPAVLRTPKRGWVEFLGGSYFADELMHRAVDGNQVRLHYDLHDSSRVWIWTLDGEFVCEASATANRMGYFPEAAIERARRTRVEGIVKRRQAQIDTALRELRPQIDAVPSQVLPVIDMPAPEPLPVALQAAEAAPAAGERPAFFDSAADRYEWLMAHRHAWTDDDGAWLQAWVSGGDYDRLRDYFASRGMAWPDDDAAFKTAG